jgi:hypothetical protein
MPTTRTTRPALTSTHTATLDIIWRAAQADDWLLGFTGPRQEAGEIKARIGHGRTRAARFLGYDIVVMHADHKHDHRGHRSINGAIGLKVPTEVIRAKCAPYPRRGKPIQRTERIVDTDFSIVAQFQAEFRGVAQYYKLAFNYRGCSTRQPR